MLYPSPSSRRVAAFTMLEMAVVLAIIGLLVGGVIGGVRLLKQSELQTVISDYTKYSGAVAQFRQQYGGLPGDLLDATNFWGDDAAASVGCADAAVTDGAPGTCNGNNDGRILTVATGTPTYEEPYRAWQHLLLANLIQGDYNGRGGGAAAGSGDSANPGINVPKSRVTNAAWSFGYKAATSSDGNQYDQDLGNYLAFGAVPSGGSALTNGQVLTPQEAYQLDTKMDNGLAANGRIITWKPALLADCAADASATAEYRLTERGPNCALAMSLTLK